MLNKYARSITCVAILSVILLGCESTPTDPNGTPEWQTVFFDDFNRSNGPVGNNYHVQIEGGSGVLSIADNRLQLSGGLYYAIRYINEVNDDVIRVSVRCSTTVWSGVDYGFGVAARSRIASVDSMLQEGYFLGVFAEKDSIYIFKMTADSLGLPPAISSKAFNVHENVSYLIELTVNKEDLIGVVRDLSTGIADTLTGIDTGALLTEGTGSIHGMQANADVIYFDDFKIERYE